MTLASYIADWRARIAANRRSPYCNGTAREHLLAMANFADDAMFCAYLAGDHAEIGRLWSAAIDARIAREAADEAEEHDAPEVRQEEIRWSECAIPLAPCSISGDAS